MYSTSISTMNIIANYESSAQFLYSMNQLHAIGRLKSLTRKRQSI